LPIAVSFEKRFFVDNNLSANLAKVLLKKRDLEKRYFSSEAV